MSKTSEIIWEDNKSNDWSTVAFGDYQPIITNDCTPKRSLKLRRRNLVTNFLSMVSGVARRTWVRRERGSICPQSPSRTQLLLMTYVFHTPTSQVPESPEPSPFRSAVLDWQTLASVYLNCVFAVNSQCPDYRKCPHLCSHRFSTALIQTSGIHFAKVTLHKRGLKSPLCSYGTRPLEALFLVTPLSPCWHLIDKLIHTPDWRTW